jgi:hypothetical protein
MSKPRVPANCSTKIPLLGTLKGVGKVYVQGVIDVCSLASAKVYTAKLPVTA